MKTVSFRFFLLGIILTHTANGVGTGAKPNFVFILGEAQGWAALSTRMDPDNHRSKSDFFHTPNLAKVAEQGMRFSRFYAPSPRCTPSRVTYLTGISPTALRMTFVNTSDSGGRVIMSHSTTEMPESVTTIAEQLKTAGYTTAHFGKWHVGKLNPSRHGFDEHGGANSNSGPENSKHPNPKQFYGTVAKGIDFMTRSVKAGQPFYLQISHYGGKSALDCKPETMAMLKQRVGNRNLAQLGAAAVALDADLAGVTAATPKDVEGGSLKRVLLNAGKGIVNRSREEFVVHFPHYDKDPRGPASSIHLGDHKLILYYETGARHLYNLKTDLGERNNLAGQLPDKVATLTRQMAAYLKSVNAEMPQIDESRPVGADQAPRGGGGNRPSGILIALDVNQDGKVTPAEMQNAAAVLMKFDRDRDGKLTEDEIRRGSRGGGRLER